MCCWNAKKETKKTEVLRVQTASPASNIAGSGIQVPSSEAWVLPGKADKYQSGKQTLISQPWLTLVTDVKTE